MIKGKRSNAVMIGIFFIIVVIVFALVNMFGYKALDDIQDDILGDLSHNESQTIITETHSRYPATFDGVMMVLFGLLWLGGLGVSLVREEHPVLFGVYMFIIIFVLIAGMFVANSFEDVFQDAELSSLTTTFPATFWLITHILQVGIGMILSIVLVVMAKNRG